MKSSLQPQQPQAQAAQATAASQKPLDHPVMQLQASRGNQAANRAINALSNAGGTVASADSLRATPIQRKSMFRGLSHELIRSSSGQPLAEDVRCSMEQALNVDLKDVRVHTDEKANQLNQALSAVAFTSQRDIFFRQNRYEPYHPQGRQLLAHELAHVVQQTQEQIQPTTQIDGLSINDNPRLEQAADAIAHQVTHAAPRSTADSDQAKPAPSISTSQPVIQRMVIPKDEVGVEQDIDTNSINFYDQIEKIKDPQILDKIIAYIEAYKKTPKDRWSVVFLIWQKGEIARLIQEINELANPSVQENQKTSDAEELEATVMKIIQQGGHKEAANWLKLYIESYKNLSKGIGAVDQQNHRDELMEQLLITAGKRATDEATEGKGGKIAIDPKERKLLEKSLITKKVLGQPGNAAPYTFLKDERAKLLRDQKQAKKNVKNPGLKINKNMTIDGHKVLKWFNEVTRVELSQFYDSRKTPATAIDKTRRPENITFNANNWLDKWAQLAWKDQWAQTNVPSWQYGKANKASGFYPLIGKLNLGSKAYDVEDKLWVKPQGAAKATRYNDMGNELAKGKTAANRAENIRKVIKGDLTGVDAHEQEAALAMLGAETARNPRSYGVGLMLLDLVENNITYGNNKQYSWDKILGSHLHPRENREQYKQRKTNASVDKKNRWSKMFSAISAYAPQFKDKPFVSLWAGKWSMSPSASLSLGSPTVPIPSQTEDLNTVQYKELKTIINWYINLMQGVELDVDNEADAEKLLKKLFQKRLQSKDKFTNEMMKQEDV
ncbi:DUF4157 domain-containing protein [Leptolyngbya sp. AS-A5]